MAIVWTFVIMTGALSVTFFQYRNEANLYRITKQKGNVQVIRNGNKTSVPFEALVPGDLVQVTPGMAFADMLLVDSEVTLVDESAITGEATPVGKTPMDPSLGKQQYSRLSHKRCTIMAGTTILEADESSRAIVLSTASFTARGELLREIFSFKRHQFKFDVEVPIVITILFFYAIFGFA
jgi:P-type E1-E2 ATPase